MSEGRKLRMRSHKRGLFLEKSAAFGVICCFGSVALAAPPAKPAPSAAAAAPTPAKPGPKPEAKTDAKAAAPAAAPAVAKPAAASAKPAKAEPPAVAGKAGPAAEKAAPKPAEKPAAPKPAAKPQPKPAAQAVPAVRPAAPAPADTTKDEVAALRSEVKALREDLNHAVGAPPAGKNPKREALSHELAEEQKKLAAIEAAVNGGLDRAAVADSISRTEARIAELQESIAKEPVETVPAQRSLYEVSSEIEKLNAAAAKPVQAEPKGANLVAAQSEPKPLIDAKPPESADMMEKMGLLPLEFTAFGDFFYRFERPGADDFHVGAVELDASLKLTPYVNVSTAIVFDGTEDAFGLGAFVIDCGIAGDGEGYVFQSKRITKSGVSFGRFDVPFGIAYLQYPSVENRLISLPHAVDLTHGAWNDIGAQGYAVGEHWTAVGYVVNGPDHPIGPDEVAPSRTAAGGRLSAKVDELIEVGGSAALDFAAEGPVMGFFGGDLATTLGPVDLRGEYLLRQVKAPGLPELTHGIYGQARVQVEPAFLVARYDTVLEGASTLDRRLSGGAGVAVFPQGEVRAVYEHSFDSDIRMMTLQLVGGSSFQPTGLRR
jgi:hypothetical protein